MRKSKDGTIFYTPKELRKMMKKISKEMGHKSVKEALAYVDKDTGEFGYCLLETYRALLGGSPEYKKMVKREKEQAKKEQERKKKIKPTYHTTLYSKSIEIVFDNNSEQDLFWEWLHEYGIDEFERFKNEGD